MLVNLFAYSFLLPYCIQRVLFFFYHIYHIFVSEVVECWLVMLRFVYTQLCVCMIIRK